MKPLLHPRTEKQLENVLQRKAQGILLSGEEGSGKYYLATWLASQMSSEFITIETSEEKSNITIDQIRQLYTLTRTGTSMGVIIKDAQTLGTEAQNAFLKLLEEPPKNIHFILTASNQELLLPTIRSRVQQIDVLPLQERQLKDVANISVAEFKALLGTSKQLAGLFFSQINSAEDSTGANVAQAKTFYTADVYQRHQICAENNYDREWASNLLSLLAIILRALLKVANPAQTERLVRQSGLVETTAQNIIKIPGNPKIHLARLAEEL